MHFGYRTPKNLNWISPESLLQGLAFIVLHDAMQASKGGKQPVPPVTPMSHKNDQNKISLRVALFTLVVTNSSLTELEARSTGGKLYLILNLANYLRLVRSWISEDLLPSLY